jgi:hypothetical protein
VCDADNDNVPTDATPAKPKWREANPELAAASAELANRHRKEKAAVEKAEAKSCRRAGARARHRQILGEDWDGKPDNDNGWPLARALLDDDKRHLLKYAMAYRRIESSANSQALLGGSSLGFEPVQIDQRTWVRPDGALVYKGERKITAAGYASEMPPVQKTSTTETTMRPAAPVPKPWRGDERVNAMIDNQRRLARIKAALGPVVEPFERLCIDGATLEVVGRELGSNGKARAEATAKAVAIMALYTIATQLGHLKYEDVPKAA